MTPCSICGRVEAPSYLRLVRVSAGGEAVLTQTCSVRCMMQWVYQYASLQGARVVYGVREVIRQAAELFKPRTD